MAHERRMVINRKTGEKFIETPVSLWTPTLHRWLDKHSQFCPMPVGHQMFKYPELSGCERIETA